MRRSSVALLLLAVLGGACARSGLREPPDRPSDVSTEDRARAEELQRSIARLEQELAPVRLAATPDCSRACELSASICELAERICALATRYPATDPLAAQCTDTRALCQRVAATTAERCGCRPAP